MRGVSPLYQTVLTEGHTDPNGRRGSSSSVLCCCCHHHRPWVLAGWQSQPRIRIREVSLDALPFGPDSPTLPAASFLVYHLLPKVPREPSALWSSLRAQSPWHLDHLRGGSALAGSLSFSKPATGDALLKYLPATLPSFLQHLCSSSLTQGVPDPCPCVALLPLTCLTQHPLLPTPPHEFITLWSVFPLPTVEGMLCKSQDLFSSLLVTSGESGAIN